MRKIDVLIWGMKHIAKNHSLEASTNLSEGGVCIFGGNSVPLTADVGFLCEDLGIPRMFVEGCSFGIDVFLPENFDRNAEFRGDMMWKRADVALGI